MIQFKQERKKKNMNKDWFDTHIEVMTLNDDKVREKQIKKSLKNALTSQRNDVFVNCRSCKQIITNDYRSTFDKRYCSDCL